VFGPFLLVGEELRGQGLDLVVGLTGAESQEVHVGAGVERSQRAIRAEHRPLQRHLVATRRNDLEDVPGKDVLLGGLDPSRVLLI
jgi:hypothetical protein